MLLPFMGGKAFSASPKLEDACESHGGVLFIRIHPLLAERLPQTPQPDSLLPGLLSDYRLKRILH